MVHFFQSFCVQINLSPLWLSVPFSTRACSLSHGGHADGWWDIHWTNNQTANYTDTHQDQHLQPNTLYELSFNTSNTLYPCMSHESTYKCNPKRKWWYLIYDVFLLCVCVCVCLQTAISQSIYHGIIFRADNQLINFTIKEKILIFKLFTFISLFKGYVYIFIILN